jgi:PST family polysaccharide transporter
MIYKDLITKFGNIFLLYVFGSLFPLITIPLYVNWLSIDTFGLYSYVISISYFLTIIVDYGFNIIGVKRISEDKSSVNVSNIVSSIVLHKLLISIILLSIYVLLVYLTIDSEIDKKLYYSMVFLVIANAINPFWIYQCYEKISTATNLLIVSRVVSIIVLFSLDISNNNSYLINTINGTLLFVVNFYLLYNIIYNEKIYFSYNTNVHKALIIESLPLFLSNISILMYTNFFTIIVGLNFDNSKVAVFSICEKLLTILKSIYTPVIQTIFPFINSNTSKLKERIYLIKKINMYTIIFYLFCYFIFIIIGKEFLIFILNDDYIEVYYLFIFSGLAPLFAALNMNIGQNFLISFGETKYYSYIIIFVGMTFLIISNFVVKFFNIYGITSLFLFSELTIFLLFYLKYIVKLRNMNV